MLALALLGLAGAGLWLALGGEGEAESSDRAPTEEAAEATGAASKSSAPAPAERAVEPRPADSASPYFEFHAEGVDVEALRKGAETVPELSSMLMSAYEQFGVYDVWASGAGDLGPFGEQLMACRQKYMFETEVECYSRIRVFIVRGPNEGAGGGPVGEFEYFVQHANVESPSRACLDYIACQGEAWKQRVVPWPADFDGDSISFTASQFTPASLGHPREDAIDLLRAAIEGNRVCIAKQQALIEAHGEQPPLIHNLHSCQAHLAENQKLLAWLESSG